MRLKYYESEKVNNLVEESFHLSFEESDLPFESTILPICSTAITFIFKNQHRFIYKKKETEHSGLIVSGQFYDSYKLTINKKGHSFGILLHPTALYKLTGLDISTIKNKHLPLKNFSTDLFEIFNPIFVQNENNGKYLVDKLNGIINHFILNKDPYLPLIDDAINLIHTKEGMLNNYELLEGKNASKRNFETQFKKIVGLTPGRYIKLYRFVKLMRKYESGTIKTKDLLYMYNYYDHSHFYKDFKRFMNQSPRDYFKTDHALLNQYLNK